MPGSTVTTMPAASGSPCTPAQSRRLVDLETDAVTGAVTEVRRRSRPRSITSRAAASTSRPFDAGAHGRQTGTLRLQHDVVDEPPFVADIAGGEGARNVAAVARRRARRCRSPRARRRRCAAGAGDRRAPWAPCSPAATIVSNDGPSAPSSRSSTRICQATSSSVRPTRPVAATSSSASSAMAAARRTAAISSASFTRRRRRRCDRPRRAGAHGGRRRSRRCAGVAQGVALDSRGRAVGASVGPPTAASLVAPADPRSSPARTPRLSSCTCAQ